MAKRNEAHSALVREIRLELGNLPDFRVWPNNNGVATYEGGAKVKYGLVKGASDLIGCLAPSGRFVAFEVKTGDATTTAEQELFLALIRKMGGCGSVVHSLDEARAALQRARDGASE